MSSGPSPTPARPDDRPPATLLLHGLAGAGADWRGVARRLTGPVVAPDLPCHGGRPARGELHFEALAADVLGRLDTLGVGPVDVVGVSLGAATAMTMAVVAPDRVRSMLLVAPSWLDESDPPNLRPLRRVGRLLARAGPERAWDVLRRVPPLCHWQADVVEQQRRSFMAADPAAVARALDELPTVLPLVPSGSAPSRPTKVLTWTDDPVHPIALAERTAAVLGGAELDVVARPPDWVDEARLLASSRLSLNGAASPQHRQ